MPVIRAVLVLVAIRRVFALCLKGGGNATTTPEVNDVNATDLVCMRWTGHSCILFGCKDDIGTKICKNEKCVCPPGTCAVAAGRCERPETPGKWLSTHAIRFADPVWTNAPYITAALDQTGQYTVQATWDSAPKWYLAASHDNFIRFELVGTTEKVEKVLVSKRVCYSIDDPNDAWYDHVTGTERKECYHVPAVMDFGDAHPLDVDFLVHNIAGGLEIWDPEYGVAFASSDRDKSGIGFCGPGNMNTDGCTRNFVVFEPPLPAEAVSHLGRIIIHHLDDVWHNITR